MGKKKLLSFARELGVAESTLRNYLEGREPKASFLAKVISQTGVSADWLLLGHGAKFPESNITDVELAAAVDALVSAWIGGDRVSRAKILGYVTGLTHMKS